MIKYLITIVSNKAIHIHGAAIMTDTAIMDITIIATIIAIIVLTSIVTILSNKAENTSVLQQCCNFSKCSIYNHHSC